MFFPIISHLGVILIAPYVCIQHRIFTWCTYVVACRVIHALQGLILSDQIRLIKKKKQKITKCPVESQAKFQ